MSYTDRKLAALFDDWKVQELNSISLEREARAIERFECALQEEPAARNTNSAVEPRRGSWYAYGIGEKQAFPELARHRKPVPMESVHGVGGNQVFLYPVRDFAIIVSEHDLAETLNQKAGVDHARVLADCFQHSTVLPFRFGTVFKDDESLCESIRSNARQFQTDIDKLRGKAEMHLKIIVDDCSSHNLDKHVPAEGVGREYLCNPSENQARTSGRLTRARALSFKMHRFFMPLDEEVSCRLTGSGEMVLDIAHLIDRKYVERYQNRFATTSAMMRDCQMHVSGPWPPYHFVHRLSRTSSSLAGVPAEAPAPARDHLEQAVDLNLFFGPVQCRNL